MSFLQVIRLLSLGHVDRVKCLGVLYIPSLDFRPHIDYIISKSLDILGLIWWHSEESFMR